MKLEDVSKLTLYDAPSFRADLATKPTRIVFVEVQHNLTLNDGWAVQPVRPIQTHFRGFRFIPAAKTLARQTIDYRNLCVVREFVRRKDNAGVGVFPRRVRKIVNFPLAHGDGNSPA